MNIIINTAYLISAILFILGLKGLSHPRTAVRGNMLGAFGMLLAIITVLFDLKVVTPELIIVGLVIGGLIGVIFALKVEMTSMPQLVAIFNGFGGVASVLVAGSALITELPGYQTTIATVLCGWIGSVTFFGSFIAFGKLQGLKIVPDHPVSYPGQQIVKVLLVLVSIGLGALIVIYPTTTYYFWILVGVASILGVLLVIAIGGADMPVVIALLNSYSGIAATATGFILSNSVLIIAGTLVGASGIILTKLMCKAMNRSLSNVLFGGFGGVSETANADDVYGGKIKRTSAEEVAMLLDTAQRVVIVPGYGMAVGQAQHAVRDVANFLESKGIEVDFAIHPVAGRMPGHMNVLLAEADIPYDKLKEMDEINPTLAQVDVGIVLGANDVVNPDARNDPKSPIAGMPIIDIDKAKMVIVIKRSLSPGFAGIPNPLFAMDNALMFFSDGKKAMLDLLSALKDV